MLHIRYEYLSESYPRFRVYKLREQGQIQQYVLHENLVKIVDQSYEYPKYDHIFMLDESRFDFFRFDMYEHFDEAFTLQNLQDMITQKCEKIKKQRSITGEKLVSYIDTVYVNGEAKNYVIGEKGDIFFRLYIMYIDQVTLHQFQSLYGDILQNKKITIMPQSFYTALFLRDSLKKESFLLLYITETYCKAIKIQHGFYHSVDILNLGLGALKQMYKDNGIAQYRYKTYEFIESNSLAKGLVIETLQFYVQLLCKRLEEKEIAGTDIVVVSSITKNQHFLETFNQEYAKTHNNYIMPFHHSDTLDSFGKQRDPEDMDAWVFMNKEQKVKKQMTGQ